jgi:hypothetical protein
MEIEMNGLVEAPHEAPVESERRSGTWLVEVGAYVGGLLMLSGAGVLVADSWEHLTRGTRVWLLAGFAAVFALAGVLAAGGPNRLVALGRNGSSVRRRITGLLLALAAVPAGAAVGVGLDHNQGTYTGLVGFAVAVAGLALTRTVAGLVASVGMSLWTLAGFTHEVITVSLGTVALLTVALGLAWAVLAVLRWVPARTVALALGTATALVGAQLAGGDHPRWAYGLMLGIGVATFAGYPWVRSIVLLVAGVIGLTGGITCAVADLAGGAMSQALYLSTGGAVVIAASLLGMRLSQANRRPA